MDNYRAAAAAKFPAADRAGPVIDTFRDQGHIYADLEKGVDPGNLVPREKLTVVDLHENFHQNAGTFVEDQSHLA